MTTTPIVDHRTFHEPDERREFTHGHADVIAVGAGDVSRLVLEPGWRWSDDVRPIAGTHSCLVHHMQYHVSGRLAIRMEDGTEFVAEPGDVVDLPPGHDAWVVGDEPAVVIDWHGATTYAKRS